MDFSIKGTKDNPEISWDTKKAVSRARTGSRQIEVKGRTGDDHFVALNEENIKAFDKEENFWLYIVHFDKNDNPTVMELNREEVEKKRAQAA